MSVAIMPIVTLSRYNSIMDALNQTYPLLIYDGDCGF